MAQTAFSLQVATTIYLWLIYLTASKELSINNLIGILDQTYPGVNTYFDSPARSDGSQKWVDFASTYWHVDCVRKMSLNAFIDHYQNWCKRKKYNFSRSKAEEIYGKGKGTCSCTSLRMPLQSL